MGKKEGKIQNACWKLLRDYGFKMIRVNAGVLTIPDRNQPKGKRYIQLAKAGTSDLLGCTPDGKFIAVEVKQPGQKPSESQKKFLNEIDKRKGLALWVDSTETLEDVILKLGYRKTRTSKIKDICKKCFNLECSNGECEY